MGALAVLLFAAAGIFIYIQAYYHALPDIQEVFAQGGGEQIQVDALDAWITYGDTKSGRGFIFYPGAKVEEEAYGPLMREIAAEDFFCVLVRMPGRLAVLGSSAAEDVMLAYPEIEEWYLSGHSLGGAMAAGYAAEHAEELSGLVKQIKDSTDKIAALQDEISRVEAESAARAEEERVRREAEAQARRESVAEAEMREVDEDEEAKKNGEMTGYEEETTGEEAAEYTDETEDEADTAYTEGSEDEADTAYAEETEEAAEEETVAEEGEVDETAEPASEEGPGDAETEEPEQNSEWL